MAVTGVTQAQAHLAALQKRRPIMIEPDPYFLGYRQAEQERLQQQAQDLAHESIWLFEQVGLSPGARVVEMGCGPHGCLDLLSERVGPAGSVMGVERNADEVALARQMVAERRLANVEVLERDARSTGLPRASFDLATARLVLVAVPNPEQIIAEAAALVRPGGWVALHEADYVSHVCDPALPAWTALVDLLETYSAMNGIDPFLGRKLPRLLRDAGLVEVRVNPIIHVYPPGHSRRSILLDFAENLSERLLAAKLVGERELSDMKAALRQHLANPDTLVVSHLFFQAWGRKPA
jgi:ubiquinone/menaquinone biosynthesis C-methylase UbiE